MSCLGKTVPEDAWHLEQAARILTERSQRPRGFWLGVLCHLLRSCAKDIRREEQERERREVDAMVGAARRSV